MCIRDRYIFEVSSPGLTRPLKKDKDYEKSIGRMIEIKLFSPVDKSKAVSYTHLDVYKRQLYMQFSMQQHLYMDYAMET